MREAEKNEAGAGGVASDGGGAVSTEALSRDFSPAYLRLQRTLPNPLPRLMLRVVAALCILTGLWSVIGSLDIIASAEGKLVPREYLKIVQPADTGVLREILVREGQTVDEGQVLFRFDPVVSQSDERSLENELALRDLQLRRIEAELTGAPLSLSHKDPPQYRQQTLAQLESNRRAYQDALAAERYALERARSELRAALEVYAKLGRTEPILRATYERASSLVDEGFVTQQFVDEKQRDFIERTQDLAAQQFTVSSLRSAVEQGEKKMAQIVSGYRQNLAGERVQAEIAHNKLREDLAKQRYRASMIEVRAPRRGIVKDLATHTGGAFIQAGTQLLSIVPTDDVLEAEVLVRNEDVAFVRMGQRVQIKLAAYPYTRYGMLEGKVIRVSPDASEVNSGDNGQQRTDGKLEVNSTYRARIALENQFLVHEGRQLVLIPGLQVAAEVHLGKRSVLAYLLSPIRSSVHEAARER